MDKLKQQIKRRLIANIIIDKCAHSEYLIFRDAWCTQDRVLRFTTPFFRKLFPILDAEGGKWKTGDSVMYEANNGENSFTVNCILSPSYHPYVEKADYLFKAASVKKNAGSNDKILKTWDLSRSDGDANKLFDSFDYLIDKEIPYYEQLIQEQLDTEKQEAAQLQEGAAENKMLNKYERNPKARAACIAAHGTACAVCGTDFGKAYGPEFTGKIEVHHIIPISKIGEEYVIDPIEDLIPVCPNCHTALHSKKTGVYTVEELREIRRKNKTIINDL